MQNEELEQIKIKKNENTIPRKYAFILCVKMLDLCENFPAIKNCLSHAFFTIFQNLK